MKLIRLFIVFIFFLFMLTPHKVVNAIEVEWSFKSFNRSNIVWETAIQLITKSDGTVVAGPYRDWIDLSCSTQGESGNLCLTYGDYNFSSPYDINDLNYQWGTGCIDPVGGLNSVGFGPRGQVYWTGWIDITLSNSNLNRLSGIDPESYNFIDDIQWYENNGGASIPFSDFRNINTCPRRPAFSCSRNNPGQCVSRQCNPATDNNCYNTNSCGGTQCEGPISGQVFLPNGNPLNGARVDRNGGNDQTTRNISGVNGSFRWTGLNIFSNHTVRLIRSSYDQCVYDINDNTRNVEVIDNNVNFNLNNVLYNINARADWDLEANGTINGVYNRDNIRFTAQPGGRDCTTSDGTCSITGNPTDPGGRDYDIALSGLQAGDIMYSQNPITRRIVCGNVGGSFVVTKGYRIQGTIFRDLNFNGVRNNGEDPYTRGTIVRIEELSAVPASRARPRIDTTQTVNDGTYLFTNLFRGRYRITMTDLSNYPADGFRFTRPTQATTPKSWEVAVGPPASVCNVTNTSPDANCVPSGNTWSGSVDDLNFAITPIYSISGGAFIDEDGDEMKDPGENYWNTTPQTFTILEFPSNNIPNTTLLTRNVNNTDGTFSFSHMLERTFRIYYNWQAEIFQFFDVTPSTTPGVGTPPYFTLYFDRNPASNCFLPRIGIPTNPDCQQSGIVNLNFALRRIAQQAWIHTLGGDVRLDNGFTNIMPDNRNFSANIGSQIKNGIIFSDRNSSGVNIGNRGANYNPEDWYVRDDGIGSASIKISYSNLRQSIIDSGNRIPPALSCPTSCTLSSRMVSGSNTTTIYEYNGNTRFTNAGGTFTVPDNQNYIFLINGDLTIDTDIIIPQNSGSTITFAAARDIFIRPNVRRLHGIYSSGRVFKFDTAVTDTVTGLTPDTQIEVQGNIIAGGQFQQRVYGVSRTLTPRESDAGTNGTPTIIIRFRPDFVLNLPAIIRTALSKRIEVSPGE